MRVCHTEAWSKHAMREVLKAYNEMQPAARASVWISCLAVCKNAWIFGYFFGDYFASWCVIWCRSVGLGILIHVWRWFCLCVCFPARTSLCEDQSDAYLHMPCLTSSIFPPEWICHRYVILASLHRPRLTS